MEDAQLLRRAILGEPEALDMLIDRYYNAIYAFCCRRTGNTALGADLCQDAFLKMVQYLPRYREQGSFKSWLFTIAANCCRDAHRKKRPTAELGEHLPDTGVPHEETTENAALLRDALEKLPEAQREAVLLRYYHDFTAAEIARIQKVPAATAKTRIHRGLVKLHAILGEEINLES